MQRIVISIARQTLTTYEGGQVLSTFAVSTAAKGAGELKGSYQTPRGLHYIRAKIGEGAPENAVFVGRRFTGEIYNAELAAQFPQRDWILTRILWLCGRETGRNRLGAVDTMARYIYIHGTPDSESVGIAKSHGCIRMHNQALLRLFTWVKPGCPVLIEEN
ncbi:MAG: L,D-transpeptidase [Oceanospirillaceae bacterium]|nr:L,D-transpeptidase [Oceanospirillaceae bacterium]MCP5350602.1 L,D-transpeptidase [Oceanospirillaceae bacterium]